MNAVGSAGAASAPVVALVGRPNVGKSTLFNRLVARRTALVEDRPGVTRDRILGMASLDGRSFQIIDTGGFDSDPDDPLLSRMREQTQLAIDEADLVLLIMDGMEGLQPADSEVAQLLRRSGKPVLALVNKVDHPTHLSRTADFYELGFDPVIGVSAEHGLGMGEVIEALCERFDAPPVIEASREKAQQPVSEEEPKGDSSVEWDGGSIRVAVIGRPNVGKSSLINQILGQERLLATDIAGTTRDPIDAEFIAGDQRFVFVDTAGIRRKKSIADRLERFSVMAAMRSVERADVAILVLDATTAPSEQDIRVGALAHEQGKGVIIVANKWDLIENPEWKEGFPKAVRLDLGMLGYAPLIRISAKTGRNVHKILDHVVEVQRERHRRVGTSALNRFFKEVVEHHGPPMHKGKRARLYYATQPLVRPPTFFFTAGRPDHVPGSYARFLRNSLRERFGFEGTPIWLKFRARGKQKKQGRKGSKLDR